MFDEDFLEPPEESDLVPFSFSINCRWWALFALINCPRKMTVSKDWSDEDVMALPLAVLCSLSVGTIVVRIKMN